MKLINAKIITPYKEILGGVEIENGKIKRIFEGREEGGEDLEGMYLLPGFVDIHIHGIGGYDFTSWNTAEEFLKNALEMKKLLIKHGVTTFVPTTVTIPKENLLEACKAAGEIDDPSIPGIHLEGPYISEKHAGAQDLRYVRKPDLNEVKECVRLSKGRLLTMTMAPEKDLEFIPKLVELGIHPSIGHTDADYETAVKAFLLGVDRTTHIFNAMRSFHHREPGAILASLNFSRYIEVILDFIHVNEEVVKFLIKTVGVNRIVAVTDSILATSLSDGEYSLGKMTIRVDGGIAKTKEGRLAGSTLTMDKALRNLSSIVGIIDGSLMSSYNPALSLGLTDRGAIEKGKRADLIVLNEKLEVKIVYLNGERSFE